MGFVFTCKGGESYFVHEDFPTWKDTLCTLSQLYPGIGDSIEALYRRSKMHLENTVVYDRILGSVTRIDGD